MTQLPQEFKAPDGVVTRNAVCEHCGYHLSGSIIADGETRCPECGQFTHFQLIPSDKPRLSDRERGLGFALTVGLFGLAVLIPLAFVLSGWALAVVVMVACVAVVALAPRIVRRLFGL